MQNEIAVVAIRFAVVCFALYVILTLAPLFQKKEESDDKGGRGHENIAAGTIPAVSELVNALAALAEALAKAGPALWSLIGSILFLLIAAMAAGVFV